MPAVANAMNHRAPCVLVLVGLLGLLTTSEARAQLFTKAGSFTAPSGGGPPNPTQSITGVGFTPAAVVFFWTRQTSTGGPTFAAGASFGYGFAACGVPTTCSGAGTANERAIDYVSDNGIVPNDSTSWESQTYSIVVLTLGASPTADAEANLTSMDADGFSLRWATKASSGWTIQYIAIGGPDVTASKVGTFQPGAGTGSEIISGIGFEPDFMMFLSIDVATGTDVYNTAVTHGKAAIGFAGRAGGVTLTQAGLTAASRNGSANVVTSEWQEYGEALLEKAQQTGVRTLEAQVSAFGAPPNELTINKIVHTAGTETDMHYLALQGGQYKIGQILKPTTVETPDVPPNPTWTDTRYQTDVGFQPHGIIFASDSYATVSGTHEDAKLAFGAADTRSPRNEVSSFFHDRVDDPPNSDNTAVANATSTNTAIFLGQACDQAPFRQTLPPVGTCTVPGSFRTTAAANIASFDTLGFTLSWTTVDNTNVNWAGEDASQIFYVAMGNDETTAVSLASFTARGGDGEVVLQWQTASETQNLGFHVYRALSEAGPYERITDSPIPGLGTSSDGATYSYRDTELTNGVTYFYKLEDIETTGRTELHGPVSATPESGATIGGGGDGSSPTSATRITYGDPGSDGLSVLGRGRGQTEITLATGGFYAAPQDDGTVEIEVPGFSEGSDSGVPTRRLAVPVEAGRGVRIASVRADDVVELSLRPAAGDSLELFSSDDGVVRPVRRRRRAGSRVRQSAESWARILAVEFQGDVKKAWVELSPFQWEPEIGRLRFARRLTVRLVSSGRERDEIALGGSRGRRYHETPTHAEGELVARLAVEQPGLYRVRFEDIFTTGRLQSLDVASLRLSRLGEPVAFHVEPDNGRYGPGSALYFLSDGASLNPYSREAVYELEAGREPRLMPVASAQPSGLPSPFYWQTVDEEQNRYYQAALLDAPDRWFWDVLFAPVTKDYPFDLVNLATVGDPSRLVVRVQGASDLEGSPDHHLRIYVNGTLVGENRWDGKESRTLTASLAPGLLHEGENRLEIENVGDTAASYSMVMLDRFSVTYPRLTRTTNGILSGRWSQSGLAQVAGLGGGSFLLDATEEPTRWLTGGEAAPDGLRFRVEAGHRYVGVSPESILAPRIRQPLSTRLRATRNRFDYLIIGPDALLGAASPLLELRRSQGLRPLAVSLEEIYSEFGFGEERPEAIRDFLAYAYHHWSAPPRYVLLLGDATYDYKNYLGLGVPAQVPALLVPTSLLWTVSDPALASVNGEDPLPDLAIGRLPASNLDQARAMVEKIVSYETRVAGGEAPVVLIADNPDRAGDFQANAEELASGVLGGRNVRKIYLAELGPAATRSAILEAFDEGSSLMSYIGHGGIHLWADEDLFDIASVSSLEPQSRTPLLLTMNCLNGYFLFPYFDSLAEALLKVEDKGVVAAISPSGLSLDGPANVYHQALLREILGGRYRRLGDAVLAAQSDYADSGQLPELLLIYHLLGDPALVLHPMH